MRVTDTALIKIALGVFFALLLIGGVIFAVKNSLFTPIVVTPLQSDEEHVFPDIEIKNKPLQEIIKDEPVVTDTKDESTENPSASADWNTFNDDELGLSFKYPGSGAVSDCYTDQNCPEGVFNIISVHTPLNSSYDIWAYKSVEFSVSQGLCPERTGTEVSHKGLTWLYESPAWAETSDTSSRNKIKMYTLEKGQVCFRVVERIYGPKDARFGALTGSQPKNLEAFFADEFKVLDEIFQSFELQID